MYSKVVLWSSWLGETDALTKTSVRLGKKKSKVCCCIILNYTYHLQTIHSPDTNCSIVGRRKQQFVCFVRLYTYRSTRDRMVVKVGYALCVSDYSFWTVAGPGKLWYPVLRNQPTSHYNMCLLDLGGEARQTCFDFDR